MGDQFQDLLTKRNLSRLLVLAILTLAIPLGTQLLRQQQILQSRAAGAQASFVEPNVELRPGINGIPGDSDDVLVATSGTVGLSLKPPSGWSTSDTASPSPSPSSSASPSPSGTQQPGAGPEWDLKGIYDYQAITISCSPGVTCDPGAITKYMISVNTMDKTTGAFEGVFFYVGESPTDFFARFRGTETGSNLEFRYIEPDNPGYYVRFRGAVNADGSMGGQALSSEGIKFDWRTTAGAAKKI